jgi:hypothetical protein
MEIVNHIQAGLLSRFRSQLAEGETSDRAFGLTVGAIFMALSIIPVIRHRPAVLWMVILGALLLAVGIAAPAALHKFKRAWLFLGFVMGLVVSPVVLGALFYLVITPCGFLMRLCGGDPLRLRRSGQQSYWREHSAPISTMKDQF